MPVRTQATLALAPVLALALKLARMRPPSRSRKLPRVPPLPLRELPQAPRELRAPQAPPRRLQPPRLHRATAPLREAKVLGRVPVLAPPLDPAPSQRELPPPLALPPREPSLAPRAPPPRRCRKPGWR